MKKIKNNSVFLVSTVFGYLFRFSMCLIVISMLSCLNILTVKADELKTYDVIDFSLKGSISITLSDSLENTKVEGANIKIYKVADAYEEKNNLAFSYHDDLKTCQEDLEKGKISDRVLKCVKDSEVDSVEQTTNYEGVVKFENLDLGLYLITQTNKVEGYSKIEEFLIMIPEILDNKWNYNIEALPKVDIIRLFDLTIEKVWNVSDDSNVPNEITVQLLKKGEVIDTIVLNDKNNWSYTWNQIEKSDEYSVKEINIPQGYTATYRQEENKFIITNTKTLMQTGMQIWIIELLTVLGMLFIVTGFICEKRNKYE